ncbi:hypothetical protein [Hymenobacter sp. DG01]|uniref:hypothetical protein n=1 Tax=Hymenobacter sp. DG01 TaxID=2584940 RepID=UPI0011220427|nr:hypothetical protein [Hymenobacter sp. DG01]
MRTLFCAALLSGAPALAQAQAPTPLPDSATTYKHQLGLTASPVLEGFFRNNRSLPLGLLYKRQVRPNQAWRLGAVGSYRYTKRYKPYPLTNRDFSESSLSVEAYTGYEWQKALTRRWVGYAGVDVGVGYTIFHSKEYSERGEVVNGELTVFSFYDQNRQRTYAVFARPLVGARYQLRPFLYLSAEAALSVRYNHYRFRGSIVRTFRDTGELVGIGEGRSLENQTSATLRPLSQISVHYLFGRP